jgi:hypothetical protein
MFSVIDAVMLVRRSTTRTHRTRHALRLRDVAAARELGLQRLSAGHLYLGNVRSRDARRRGSGVLHPRQTRDTHRSAGGAESGVGWRIVKGKWEMENLVNCLPISPLVFPLCHFPIYHFPSAVSPLPFSLCHFPSAISHLPFSLCHFPSAISHLPFSLCHFPSPISHLLHTA